MSYLIRITYKSKSYASLYERNGLVAKREDVEPWVTAEMERVASGGGGNQYENVQVYIGEVQEQYTAARIWQLTPVNGTVKPAKVSDTTAIEI